MGTYINNASTAKHHLLVYAGAEMIVINDLSHIHAPERKYGFGYSPTAAIKDYVSFRASVKRK